MVEKRVASPTVVPTNDDTTHEQSTRDLYIMLFLLCFFANGFMPSISTYVSKPYGALAYHVSTILGTVANPAACLAGAYWMIGSRRAFYLTFTFTLVCIRYTVYHTYHTDC